MAFQHFNVFGLHGGWWAEQLPQLVEGAQGFELPLLEGGRGVLLAAVPRAPSGGHTVGGEVGLLAPLGGELGPEGLEERHGEGEAWGGVMVYRKVCGYTPAGRRGKGREVEGVVGG